MGISVRLLQPPSVLPIEMASHAAKMCYNPELPELGGTMNIEASLFKTGHHTTLEHTSYTFAVEGIAVGDITLGFHLVSPFYNSDQRSGRYCSDMFKSPDTSEILKYVQTYYPEVSDEALERIDGYVRLGIGLFNKYEDEATAIAERHIADERPHYPGKGRAEQAHKLAQEQMRVLIPVIMPTAFDFTVNLTTLVALYKSAFTPVMRAVTQQMADLAIEHDSRIAVMFKRPEPRDWFPRLFEEPPSIVTEPRCKLLDIHEPLRFSDIDEELCHPVDQLHFRPELMNNGLGSIVTQLTLSLMTMGQNQRHRTIHRGAPEFTGGFYLPPLLAECGGILKDYQLLVDTWELIQLYGDLPGNLVATLAPYGAMVTYLTSGDFNAVCHEQAKRLCWNAQEEIYSLSRQLQRQIYSDKAALLTMFEPPCFRHGKCLEGKRYCGREISVRESGDYFPKRII